MHKKEPTQYVFTLTYGLYGKNTHKNYFVMNNILIRVKYRPQSFLKDIRLPFLETIENTVRETGILNSTVDMAISILEPLENENYKNFFLNKKLDSLELIKILSSEESFEKSDFYNAVSLFFEKNFII